MIDKLNKYLNDKRKEHYRYKYHLIKTLDRKIAKDMLRTVIGSYMHIDHEITRFLINKKYIEFIYLSDWLLTEVNKSFYIDQDRLQIYDFCSEMYIPLLSNNKYGNVSIPYKKKIDTARLFFICLYGKEHENKYNLLKDFKYSDSDLTYNLKFWKELHDLVSNNLNISIPEEPLPEFEFDL